MIGGSDVFTNVTMSVQLSAIDPARGGGRPYVVTASLSSIGLRDDTIRRAIGDCRAELPPSERSIDYDSLDHEKDDECRARSTSRKRSSGSYVRSRSCWAKAARPPRRADGSLLVSRPTIGSARNIAS